MLAAIGVASMDDLLLDIPRSLRIAALELPRPGRKLAVRESFGVVESVKAASDLYSPVAGRVTAVNDKLTANPELVNSDPYGDGWIMKLELTGDLPADLLDEAAYKKAKEASAG